MDKITPDITSNSINQTSVRTFALPIVLITSLSVCLFVFLFGLLKKEQINNSVSFDIICLFLILSSAMALAFCILILKAQHNIINSIQEIADRSNAEIEEQRHIALQSAKMSALGEMVGGIAHEINTPLAAVKMFLSEAISELEKGDHLDEGALANYLHKSDAIIDRIAKIIKGLRTFARSGELDPFQEFSVQECIEDSMILCGDRFKNESVELKWEIPASTIMIECRPIEITQVLINLMNNALDAVSNLPQKWVILQVDDTPDFVQIRVTDSGPGISPEIVEKMFQPFFTTKEIGKGTGIGLSISVGIIKSHHGRLFVDPGHLNTSFVIEIPKHQGDLELDLSVLEGVA